MNYKLSVVFVFFFNQLFPFAFILMTKKTRAAYEHVFNYINREVFPLDAKSFTTDYEIAIRNALKGLFPNADYTSCWFHFCQACKRRAASIDSFFEVTRRDPALCRIYYKLLCLPLLPSNDINGEFCSLRDAMLKEALLKKKKRLYSIEAFSQLL